MHPDFWLLSYDDGSDGRQKRDRRHERTVWMTKTGPSGNENVLPVRHYTTRDLANHDRKSTQVQSSGKTVLRQTRWLWTRPMTASQMRNSHQEPLVFEVPYDHLDIHSDATRHVTTNDTELDSQPMSADSVPGGTSLENEEWRWSKP